MSRVVLALVASAMMVPVVVRAQGVDLGGIRAKANDPDLIGARSGIGATLHLPITRRLPVSARLELAHISGKRDTVRVTCTGLVPIGADCSPEGVTTTSRLSLAGLGFEVGVVRSRRVDLLVNGEALVAKVRGSSVGHRSGSTLGGDATMTGFSAGAEAVWRPVPRAGVAVTLSGQLGQISNSDKITVIDGYSPFLDAVTLRRLCLGIGWRVGH